MDATELPLTGWLPCVIGCLSGNPIGGSFPKLLQAITSRGLLILISRFKTEGWGAKIPPQGEGLRVPGIVFSILCLSSLLGGGSNQPFPLAGELLVRLLLDMPTAGL